MGRDKALLPWREGTLVEGLRAMLARVADDPWLVGRPERYERLGLPGIGERFAGCGPLSGIEAALRAGRSEWNFVLACDLVGLEPGLLEELAARVSGSEADVIVVEHADGRLEPLCAIYHARCLPPVEKALVEGRYKVVKLLEELKLERVRTPAAERLGNANTPEDWASAGEELRV
jgi:molybdopterin-guanine dinucleotide biosynthesis protein A